MNDYRKSSKNSGSPLKTIILTVLITLIVAVIAGYVAGVLHFGSPGMKAAQMSSTESRKPQLYTCGMHPMIIAEEPGDCPICGMKLVPKRDVPDTAAGSAAKQPDKGKIIYWRAPMNPKEIYDQPGKSAMGMDLVPVYEEEVSGGVSISIDPVTQQNMGIRTSMVTKGPLTYTIRTYGHITYDETRLTRFAPKFNGWIEKLHADFTGQQVEAGEPLFEIYSPELVTAQEEYLSAYKSRNNMAGVNTSGDSLLANIKRRLMYYDIAESEFKQIEKQGYAKRTITIRSPFTGIITHKNAVEGGYVSSGETIYQIADLSRVWVEAHIYEYELPMVREGLNAEMTLPYLPGKTFTGRVAFVYPYLQRKTRDVVIRLEFDNPDMELKPDMYADVGVKTFRGDSGMMIPDEAVIRSGERDIVFVTREEGKFSPREVTLGGALDNDMVQVLSGVMTGEKVVTSGQFMLDSESRLKEAVQKMMDTKAGRDEKDDMAMGEGMDSPIMSENDTGGETAEDFFDDMDSDTHYHLDMDMKSGAKNEDDFFSDME